MMRLLFWLEFVAQRITDLLFMFLPRRRPSPQALAGCKIISHRGEHDNLRVKENTLAAFSRVETAGIWGIEFDVRWTSDLQPVVIHDTNTGRVFGIDLVVAETNLQELQRQIPDIPTLAAVVERFGGKTHLMAELKRDELGADEIKAESLRDIFSLLESGLDYHFLALQMELFKPVEFAGRNAQLLVAALRVKYFSQQVISGGLGGLCGQYLLLTGKLIRNHHAQGQQLGTGFPGSRFCLYRELNRGVDWIFTNRAIKLEALRQQLSRDR